MAELLVGAVAATGLLTLIQYARAKGIPVGWWGWTLTALAFLYAVFVLEVIVSFLREGSAKGAIVMGTILGFIAVVWAVLLARFVFGGGTRRIKEAADV
jgi:lipopolysaccharide export LptBFGC system permease protein LptF